MARKVKRGTNRGRRRLSVMVIHRIKGMMELAASVRSYKQSVSAAVGKRYAPRLGDGEELPDYSLVLDLAVRDTQAALDHLVELDDQVDDVAVKLDTLCEQRDHLAREELYRRAVTVRAAINLAFGRERGRGIHAMKGRTRRSPPHLEVQVRHALGRLTDPERELPRPKNRFATVDREGWTRQLKAPYQRLVKLRREISRKDAELTFLVTMRKRAMDAYDAAYGEALGLVTSVFVIARVGARLIKNLRPYSERRRLSREARQKRKARAAQIAEVAAPEAAEVTEATEATEESVPELIRPPNREKRAAISKTVAKWLEKRRQHVSTGG